MIWSDFEFVIHLACIVKPRILGIIWPCLLIIMIMTWLFSGILFICALVVSFAALALRPRVANDTTRAQINNIPSKSHVIPLLTIFQTKLFQTSLSFFQIIPTPPVPSSNKSLLKDFDHFARTMRLKYMFANKRKTPAHHFHTTRTELGCSRKWLGGNQTRTCFSIFPPSNG